MNALLTAVKLKSTFGAGAFGVESRGENAATAGTSSVEHRTDHARGARADLFLACRAGMVLLLLLALFRLAGILIPVLLVFSIQTDLRGAHTLRCWPEPWFPLLVCAPALARASPPWKDLMHLQ